MLETAVVVLAGVLAGVLVMFACVYLLGRPPRDERPYIATPEYLYLRDRYALREEDFDVDSFLVEVVPLIEAGRVDMRPPLQPRRIETALHGQVQAFSELGRQLEAIGRAAGMPGLRRKPSICGIRYDRGGNPAAPYACARPAGHGGYHQGDPIPKRPLPPRNLELRRRHREYSPHGTCYCPECMRRRERSSPFETEDTER